MPRVKVPRCARLLKLKLQGKKPFPRLQLLQFGHQRFEENVSQEVMKVLWSLQGLRCRSGPVLYISSVLAAL